MALNFNAEPYYDDYDEDKLFYRVLFKPGYAVQARELTQLQTILQQQVTRQGNHLFKEGSMVIPGQISLDTNVGYVKLQATYGSVNVATILSNLEGEVVVGQTTGVRALVRKVATSTSGGDPNTLMVKYLDSGTANTTKVFANNEVIAPETASAAFTVQAATSSATGTGSIATIERGIYYVRGIFALVLDQTLILEKYSTTPSYRVGLTITESFVDSNDDSTLLDNAQGSYNFAAPGADRYKILLTLAKLSTASTDDDDFLELARISSGTVQQKVRTTEYSVLEQTLARRTYDESGDYTVRPFKIDLREHRDNNRGAWVTGTAYLANDIVLNGGNYYTAKDSGTSSNTAPTHTVGEATDGVGGVTWLYTAEPEFNRGVYTPAEGGDEAKLAIGLEPGKAYVRGYEIEKIATEFVEVDKARETETENNKKITARVGNFIRVTNTNSLPPMDDFSTVTLYDRLTASAGSSSGTAIGTARVRAFEYDSGTVASNAIYKMSLFDVQMTAGYDFEQDVKQVYYSRGSAATNFTADISPIQTLLTGSVTASSSTTIDGTGTLFSSELTVGDYVYIGSSSITRRVTAVNSNIEIEVDSAVTATGAVVYKLTTTIVEPNFNSLLFPLPYPNIAQFRDSGGSIDCSYTVYEKFGPTTTSTASAGSCTLTIDVTGGNDEFASEADTNEYIIVDNTSGDVLAPTSVARQSGNTQVVVTLSDTYASTAMIVIFPVNKSDSGTEKTKTLTTVTGLVKSTQATASARRIELGKADGYRLLEVKMDTGTFGSPTGTYSIDITDRYTFDDGQRLNYYDLAAIVLKDGANAPVAPIQIAYQYFAHSGSGDYFSVNSYLSTMTYDRIPFYYDLPLRDVLDFRPRIDDTGANFTGSNALTSLIPKRGIDVEAAFSYYLARKTKIALDIKGNFFALDGVSALNPGQPVDPSEGMVLYDMTLPAYTDAASDVVVKPLDNKRYTMKDIGRLEKRIDQIEYYTALSLLEQETKSLVIQDAEGLDRFKNGFAVDNFESQLVGNSVSEDYRCSLDIEAGELHPFFSMSNVNLIEVNTLDADRTTDNYQITGDLITLPYTDTALVTQPYASRIENVNPFAIFTFLGRTDLNPASDDWIEVDRRPDIVYDVEGNYAAILSQAEQQGVLGTLWNSWQTTWSGTPVATSGVQGGQFGRGDASWIDARFGVGARSWDGRNLIRKIKYQTIATEVGQARTGVKTTVQAKIDRQMVNDRIVSTAVIPYIRSRNLLFTTRGLKPSTTVFPFFDQIDVSDYITPATRVEFTAVSGFSTAFDANTNAGGDAEETARRIGGNSEVALNKGDIVYVGTRSSTNYTKDTSPAYGVCVLTENIDDTLAVYVVNITGTFQEDDIIVGSISSARGEVVSDVTNESAGNDLTTNAAGDVAGLFDIPETDSLRFRTGTREFKLIDDSTNIQTNSTTSSRAQYRAEGVLETRQATYNAVRNAEIVSEIVTENRTITQTSDRVISDTGWYDPLAQTFLVQSTGGAFLTKCDIFFASKDDNVPVQMQIREVVNGYPGKVVLPFSRVIKDPSEVNISSSTVTVDGTTLFAPDTATSFVFDSPVYVEDGKEYCIVLLSNSTGYNCWISQMGEANAGTDRFISEQPYAGVLFKSQNASTWTADQLQDLKFTLYRAQFNTGVTGAVEFTNDRVPAKTLTANPIQTITGSGKIRVLHRGHGMIAGDTVTISGAAATNGITTGQLNTDQTVDSVELDSYIVTTAGTATSTGFGGGSAVVATQNVAYQIAQPVVAYQDFSDTALSFAVKTTTGRSVGGSETAYSTDSSYVGVVVNDNNYFNNTKIVASPINETDSSLSGAKSLFFRATMSTTNDAVSPAIDVDRLSMIMVNNKVNSPTSANSSDSDLDVRTIVSSNTNVAFTASTDTISSADSSTQDLLASVSAGKYITVTGSSEAANNATWLVTAVDPDDGTITIDGALADDAAGDSVTITMNDRYVDEIAPVGSSAYSKYVTRTINLKNPSTFLRIKIAADVPPNGELAVYYRTLGVGSSADLEEQIYTLATADDTVVQNSDGQFYEIEYTLQDLVPFDAVGVKIVLNSTDQSQVVRVKDLRIIACA